MSQNRNTDARVAALYRTLIRKHDAAIEKSALYSTATMVLLLPIVVAGIVGMFVWTALRPAIWLFKQGRGAWAYLGASAFIAHLGWKLPFTVATLSTMLFISIHTVLVVAGVIA